MRKDIQPTMYSLSMLYMASDYIGYNNPSVVSSIFSVSQIEGSKGHQSGALIVMITRAPRVGPTTVARYLESIVVSCWWVAIAW
jgi:hypothetical protein